jgi:CHAT domain-containing protein
MKNRKHQKSWRTVRFSHWLALLSCCLVILAHPVIAVDLHLASSATPSSVLVQPVLDAPQLLDTGRQRYEAGQFAEAANAWQQAARAYETQGDRLNQALSLSYLSLAAQALGDWPRAEESIITSLDLLNSFPQSDRARTSVLAQALNTQGKLQLAQGKAEAALMTWQTAERTYAQINDIPGVIGSQINQAQAMQGLGLYHRAQIILKQVNQQLKEQPPSALKVVGLRNLGGVLQITGDLVNSEATLQEGLEIAKQLNLPADISATLFSLGNTLRAAQNNEAALASYQQAATASPNGIARLEAQMNQLSLLIDMNQQSAAEALLRQLEPQLTNLSPSRTGIYVQVNWAASAIRSHTQWANGDLPTFRAIAAQLAVAVQQSRSLQDARAESFSLGHLGHLYEQTKQWTEAENLTQKALLLAQEMNAPDIAYRWYWQLGRIRKQTGDRAGAIAAYSESVNLLKALRRDLVAMSPDVQFSFREEVEPAYRELVELLVASPTPGQSDLQQARQVIEALQQVELENFLRSACLEISISEIDKADPSAAIIYPIILSDRLTVIVSLPGQPLSVHSTPLSQAKFEAVLEQTLASFNPLFDDQERLHLSGEIYDWLIRPAEAALAKSQVKTLVFVLDGALRNIPMAALHDGQRYLIEKYSVAITPGLQLLGPQTPLAKENLQVLVGALTEARQGFPALPGVAIEAREIATQLTATELLDKSFTQSAFQAQLQGSESPIVHLATHGQFSSNLDKTFILTWDNRLTIDGIKNSLKSRSESTQRPIELLILSACETAEGDKRAALGLAGLAVRSGARSTLASLWSVNDASTTELMVKFYQALTKQNLSKAAALRESQLELIHTSEYQHPFYWAPFILVGNWL